jgi:RNA polymerase sigma-70 factor (ECF subfamily)
LRGGTAISSISLRRLVHNAGYGLSGDTEGAKNFHRACGSTFMDDPDIELLRAIAEGDHLAFKRLVERYQSRLLNFLYRYLRDRETAEDLTQEAFLKVYQAAPRFEPRAKVRTWIFTIAYNLAVNELRRRQRRGFFGLFVHEDRERVTMEAPEAGDRLELAETMTKALSLLPDNQKAALLLRVRDELSYQEIGEILGVSRSSVESLLFRARERLRRLLRGREAR